MSTLAIELNDTGLIVLDESKASSTSVNPSPGFALLDGDRIVTGVAAWREARLKPRFIHSRFWEELDTAPLPRPFPRKLTRAVPSPGLFDVRSKSGVICGILLSVVSSVVWPENAIASRSIVVIGLGELKSRRKIREPVTTISSIAGSSNDTSSVCAIAGACPSASATAAAVP